MGLSPVISDKLMKRFFVACRTGNVPVATACLDQGVPPGSRDENKLTGLIWTGRKGRIDVMELLIARGVDIEECDNRSRTALFHAAVFNRLDYVQRIAALGADVNPVDCHGYTPMDGAWGQGYEQMCDLLRSLGGRHQYHQR